MLRRRVSWDRIVLFAVVLVLGGMVVSVAPSRPSARAAGSSRHELVRLRTASSSTFRNADGTLTRALFAEAVRYRAGGRWRAIDSRLLPFQGRTFGWRNASNRFHAYFGRTARDELLRVSVGARA